MPTIRYRNTEIPLQDGQSVLDALLGAGIAAPHSCRSGTCQTCMMRCRSGMIPAESQVGIKDTLRQQGYFLPCVCRPKEDLDLADADGADIQIPAAIAHVQRLSGDVVRVLLEPLGRFNYSPGQYITLVRDDGLARAYSIASVPEDDSHIELHVRRIPNGQMSRWLAEAAGPGQRVNIRGPAGECVYVSGTPQQPLTMIGTGTGLAPLYGVIRQALRSGHSGPIRLFHGALHEAGLYLVDHLLDLSARYPNFTYTRCLLNGAAGPGVVIGPLPQIIRTRLPDLKGHRIYLCGDPAMVHQLRKQVFLCGASMKQIHGDAFVTAARPAAPAHSPRSSASSALIAGMSTSSAVSSTSEIPGPTS